MLLLPRFSYHLRSSWSLDFRSLTSLKFPISTTLSSSTKSIALNSSNPSPLFYFTYVVLLLCPWNDTSSDPFGFHRALTNSAKASSEETLVIFWKPISLEHYFKPITYFGHLTNNPFSLGISLYEGTRIFSRE